MNGAIVRRTAWELIGETGVFRVPGGRATYTDVMYNEATARTDRVQIARLDAGENGLRQVTRWIEPDQELEILELDSMDER